MSCDERGPAVARTVSPPVLARRQSPSPAEAFVVIAPLSLTSALLIRNSIGSIRDVADARAPEVARGRRVADVDAGGRICVWTNSTRSRRRTPVASKMFEQFLPIIEPEIDQIAQ